MHIEVHGHGYLMLYVLSLTSALQHKVDVESIINNSCLGRSAKCNISHQGVLVKVRRSYQLASCTRMENVKKMHTSLPKNTSLQKG